MVPSFLSLENLLSDSYTLIRTLARLTIYMYYSRLLVYDIVSVVTVSLLREESFITRCGGGAVTFSCGRQTF